MKPYFETCSCPIGTENCPWCDTKCNSCKNEREHREDYIDICDDKGKEY